MEEALVNRNHVLHNKVKVHYEANEKLDNFGKDIIRKKLKMLWNIELVNRTLNQIIKGKDVEDEDCKKSAIEELLRLDLESEDIMNEAEQRFKCLKKNLKEKSIKLHNYSANNNNDNPLKSIDGVKEYIINNFSLSLLLKEEQGMLKEILGCAVKQKKSDALLLLLCNQADYRELNKNLLEEEKMPFLEFNHYGLEIQRLRKSIEC